MTLRTRCMNTRWMGRRCRIAASACLPAVMLAVAGCASAPSASNIPNAPTASASDSGGVIGFLGSMSDKALSAVGLKKPDAPDTSDMPNVPDSALPDRRITWRIFASDSLNVDANGKPLGLVLRLYKLKSPDAFLQAPVDAFGDPAKEKAALNDDLVAARELQLLPGQHYEATDKVPRDARYVGIVAMFRNPVPGRWRYAFSAAAADKTGLSIGAHACAMSIQIGEAIGQAASTVRSVAMPCP
jgi:type VI secretion system protein VasD